MLNQQYRMHRDISSFPCNTFYQGNVLDGPNVLLPSYGAYLRSSSSSSQHQQLGHYCFLNIVGKEQRGSQRAFGGAEATASYSTSICNEEEARAVVVLLRSLDKNLKKGAVRAGEMQGMGQRDSAGPVDSEMLAPGRRQQQLEEATKAYVSVGLITPYALQVKPGNLRYRLILGITPRPIQSSFIGGMVLTGHIMYNKSGIACKFSWLLS